MACPPGRCSFANWVVASDQTARLPHPQPFGLATSIPPPTLTHPSYPSDGHLLAQNLSYG